MKTNVLPQRRVCELSKSEKQNFFLILNGKKVFRPSKMELLKKKSFPRSNYNRLTFHSLNIVNQLNSQLCFDKTREFTVEILAISFVEIEVEALECR